MVEVPFDHGPKHLTVDPKLTGLFLRQCTGAVDATQHRARCTRVGAGQVISLTATTVIKDLVTAVCIANGGEALHDLAGRCVPIDFLERAVGLAPEGRSYAVFAVLVMI